MKALPHGRRLSPTAADGLLAATAYGVDLLVSWDHGHQGQLPLWVVPAYAAVGYPALVLRRRYPRTVFAVMLAHAVYADLTIPVYFPTLGLWVALYTVAARRDLRDAVGALLLALVPAGLNIQYNVSLAQDATGRAAALIGTTVLQLLVNVALFAAGRRVGWTSRTAGRAIAAERSRIARDLHDVVAHSVTLMLLQAAGASRMLRHDPDRAAVALGHVDALGQEALVELRRMLDLLRLDPHAEAADGVTSPPTGLAGISELVERADVGPGAVRLVVEGVERAVAPGVELTGYRIVQEGLTNATRYADPAHPVVVTMQWQPTQVVISIRNHIRADRRAFTHGTGGGYGLLGMRERALSVTGSLTAGVQPDGTFLVEAVLPTAVADREPARGPAAPAARHG
jgi:signal transduction histidine kinase